MVDEDGFVLPHNADFERMILGAALRNPDALSLVLQRVRAEDFYVRDHREVYQALDAAAATAMNEAAAIDIRLLANSLARSQVLSTDAHILLDQMYSNAATAAVLPKVIEEMLACSHGRKLVEVGRSLMEKARRTNGDPLAVAEVFAAADEQFRATADQVVPEGWKSAFDLARDLNDPQADDDVIPTGFPDLDRQMNGGLRPGQLVVVAGRPGFGKSTLAMDVARHASIRRNIPGLFVSLEMEGRELAARLMAAEASVPLTSIRSREPVTEAEAEALLKALENIEHAPLYIADNIEASLPVVRNWAMAMVRRRGIRYLVVDFVNLMSDGTANPSREQVIGGIAVSLKEVAKICRLAVILVAQINRGPEQRTDKRPMMSDLRDSGQLEQAADIGLLLFQPEKYDQNTDRLGEADVDVAKHRNGATGVVPLAFQGHYSRFVSLAADVSAGS